MSCEAESNTGDVQDEFIVNLSYYYWPDDVPKLSKMKKPIENMKYTKALMAGLLETLLNLLPKPKLQPVPIPVRTKFQARLK